jgi:hypothetical protein
VVQRPLQGKAGAGEGVIGFTLEDGGPAVAPEDGGVRRPPLWPAGPACTTLLGYLAGPRCAASLVPQPWWFEVVRSCLFASRLRRLVWVCLGPVSCARVLRGLRLLVFGLGSLPLGTHAVSRVPCPPL